MTTSASAATPPHRSGRRTTTRATADQVRDSAAFVRRRPSHGIRLLSTQRPSRLSNAGSTVTEPTIASPTTRAAPIVSPRNGAIPLNSSPVMHSITVRPETSTTRPEVRAVIRNASWTVRPAARSSRSRRR
jgi:hypothetical protein